MTGKEAARRSWETVSAKSAAMFLVGGVAAIIAGKYVEGADAATFYGWIAGGWGLVQAVIERTAKRTGDEFEVRVWRNFGEHKAKIDQGEKDHAACEGRHDETHIRVQRLESGLNEVAEVVGELKPGWKLAGGHE